uniref:HPP family protein n=1 Tax=Desulfobacca acetoxidans TaxID=60893 RepID=A0A7V4G6G1_9BACT
MSFWRKMAGLTQSPPGVSLREVLWSWLGAFLGIGAVAGLHNALFQGTDQVLLIGSFGASAVLLYGMPKSPLAQPRNLLGGHVISAVIGVTAAKLLAFAPGWAAALAVSLSIVMMHLSRTLHPPGGATALIAILGGPGIQRLGFFYVLVPVAAGALLLLVIALLVNNLAPQRRYPEYWW